jgi:hypothetical protein
MKEITEVTYFDKHFIKFTKYYNREAEIIAANKEKLIVFEKSSYSYNSLTRERTFHPARYVLVKIVSHSEVIELQTWETEKNRVYAPPEVLNIMRTLKMENIK